MSFSVGTSRRSERASRAVRSCSISKRLNVSLHSSPPLTFLILKFSFILGISAEKMLGDFCVLSFLSIDMTCIPVVNGRLCIHITRRLLETPLSSNDELEDDKDPSLNGGEDSEYYVVRDVFSVM